MADDSHSLYMLRSLFHNFHEELVSTLPKHLSYSENEIQNLRTMIEEGKNPFSTGGLKAPAGGSTKRYF
jgi:hypothetical protein